MLFSREKFLKNHPEGLWRGEVRRPNEATSLEVATIASGLVPNIPAPWRSLCVPYFTVEPDYEAMEEEQSDDWIYQVHGAMDLMYDALPLNLPDTTLYRLQTPNGTGVFSHGVGLAVLNPPEDGCPQKDLAFQRFVQISTNHLPQNYCREWFFACQTPDQLREWLTNANSERLRAHHIEVATYEVSGQWCIHGARQTLFQKARARQINSLPIEEFIPPVTSIHKHKF